MLATEKHAPFQPFLSEPLQKKTRLHLSVQMARQLKREDAGKSYTDYFLKSCSNVIEA